MKKSAIRRITILLVLSMLLCLALGACSTNDIKKLSAYQLVKGAVEKTAALDSYEIDEKVTTTTDLLGESMDTTISFDVKVADATGNSPKASGTMGMFLMGEEMALDMYYDGDMIYMSSEDVKVKISASDADAKTYQFSETQESLLKSLPEDILKDVQVKDNDDKSRTVALTVDGDKFSEIYSELISQLSNEEAYSELFDDLKTSISIKDADVSITVLENGYIGEYVIRFTMDLTMKSESSNLDYTVSMDINASVAFKDPGTKVTVTAPTDLDQYIDYSELESTD